MMQTRGSTVQQSDGHAPQMSPEEPRRRSSINGALLVIIAMFGWMAVVFGVSGAVARNDPNVEMPVEVNPGSGVWVTPADGWYSAEDAWEVGDTGIALRSSGVYVAFWAEPYGGSTEQLFAETLDAVEPQYEAFRSQATGPATMSGDLPALATEFTASREWGRVEGELVVMVHGGIAVTMWAESSYQGQLSWAQGDIEWMLGRLEVPR